MRSCTLPIRPGANAWTWFLRASPAYQSKSWPKWDEFRFMSSWRWVVSQLCAHGVGGGEVGRALWHLNMSRIQSYAPLRTKQLEGVQQGALTMAALAAWAPSLYRTLQHVLPRILLDAVTIYYMRPTPPPDLRKGTTPFSDLFWVLVLSNFFQRRHPSPVYTESKLIRSSLPD